MDDGLSEDDGGARAGDRAGDGAGDRRGPTFQPVHRPPAGPLPGGPVRPVASEPPAPPSGPPPPTSATAPLPPAPSKPGGKNKFAMFAIGALVGGVVCLVILGAIGLSLRASQEAEKVAEIEAAIESLDLDSASATPARETTAAETECIEDRGIDLDDILTGLTDTTIVGTIRQVELMEAIVDCAPSILTEENFVARARSGWSPDPDTPLSDAEVICTIEEILDTAPSPGRALAGQDPESALLAMETCFSEEAFGVTTQAEGFGPQTYGDDPALDQLQDLCRKGTTRACDLLYQVSPLSSAYETFASTCGGLQPVSGYCTPGMTPADGDWRPAEDSPGWTSARAACELYDMIACDLVFWLADPGSEAERFGETCGGRLAVSGGGECVEKFGAVSQ